MKSSHHLRSRDQHPFPYCKLYQQNRRKECLRHPPTENSVLSHNYQSPHSIRRLQGGKADAFPPFHPNPAHLAMSSLDVEWPGSILDPDLFCVTCCFPSRQISEISLVIVILVILFNAFCSALGAVSFCSLKYAGGISEGL